MSATVPISNTEQEEHVAFRRVPRTGVIFVMTEARRNGYTPNHPSWTNFGQGQPEAGPLVGAPARIGSMPIAMEDHEYAPIAGLTELREAVAAHYNAIYRQGRASKYTAENVCIAAGGRSALTRVAAALGAINLGHFLPDYTAYEELLSVFRLFTPIPILLDPYQGYDFKLEEFEREVLGRGLSALLLSNPCNPTGKLVGGNELERWVGSARKTDCTLILDEFYSHYVWNEEANRHRYTVSAARFIDDVDKDPVVILNGLTKNWRYPGWRISWTLAPRPVIERIASAGSFLDGGAPRPLQRATIPLLELDHTRAEVSAIQAAFVPKRRLMLDRLKAMGIRIDTSPDGTFYVWCAVPHLPPPLNTGMGFFREALKHRLICVPGEFFDVNPGRRRAARLSRFRHHVRFSFGPPRQSLEAGLDRLEEMLKKFR